MARIISASIDVTKIDKNKIQSKNKNGEPFKNGAKYLNIDIVVNDEMNDYGQDTGIKISQSKEEREAKTTATYLGNGKTVWSNDANQSAPQNQNHEPAVVDDDEDSLPF